MLQLKTLEEDLKDGQLLIELLNRLVANEEVQNLQGNKPETTRGPKSIERWDKNPRSKVQSLQNIGIALHFCAQLNIKLVNIGELEVCVCVCVGWVCARVCCVRVCMHVYVWLRERQESKI